MAIRRFIGDSRLQPAREGRKPPRPAATLRHNSSRLRHFPAPAPAVLCGEMDGVRTDREKAMRATRVMRPQALPARTRCERLGNWLGLLALLASGVVFAPVHAAGPPAEHAIKLPDR